LEILCGKTTTPTPRFSQNDGDYGRCRNGRLQKPAQPRGYGRIREFRSEFFSVRVEPTRLRLTNFRKSGRDRPETHRFDDHIQRSIPTGPLLRFKEGQPATVEVHNDTDTPEQLNWHGQMVSTDVDGAAEEGTPFIPAQGMRRIVFNPRPSGFQISITRIIGQAPISTRDNTAGKSVPCTSGVRKAERRGSIVAFRTPQVGTRGFCRSSK